MNIKLILEYIKLLGMTVVFTAGQAIGFNVVVPLYYLYETKLKG